MLYKKDSQEKKKANARKLHRLTLFLSHLAECSLGCRLVPSPDGSIPPPSYDLSRRYVGTEPAHPQVCYPWQPDSSWMGVRARCLDLVALPPAELVKGEAVARLSAYNSTYTSNVIFSNESRSSFCL